MSNETNRQSTLAATTHGDDVINNTAGATGTDRNSNSNSTSNDRNSPDTAPASDRASRCLALVQDRCAALDPTKFVVINFDITAAIAVILGALKRLRTLQDDIVSLSKTDPECIAWLETCALAMHAIQSRYLGFTRPIDDLPVVLDEANALRDVMLVNAEGLAAKKVLDGKRLPEIRAGRGYRDTASDLGALAAIYRAARNEIGGRTVIDDSDLAKADDLAERILRGVNARDERDEEAKAVSEMRVRVATLMVHAYDQVYRAVHYIRFDEKDVDQFVPHLYNRPSSARRTTEDEQGATDGADATEGASTIGSTGASGSASASASSARSGPTVTSIPGLTGITGTKPVPQGSDPFGRDP